VLRHTEIDEIKRRALGVALGTADIGSTMALALGLSEAVVA
jgi:hypothetical protein